MTMQKKALSSDDVRQAFDSNSVTSASRQQLEQLLLANGRARVVDPINQARTAEMGEIMRQLLAARQSQEIHRTNRIISVLALIVSIVAIAINLFR